MLDFNITLVYQVISFFILLFILNEFLFKPVFKVLEEREKKTTGTVEEADKIDGDAAQGTEEYEKSMKDAALKGHEKRNAIRQEGVEKEREILEDTRKEVAAELGKLREDLGKEKDKALVELKTATAEISKEIAGKIIGRALSVLFVLIPFTIPAMAVASGGEGDGFAGNMWRVGNLILFAIFFTWVYKKYLKEPLENKTEEIKNALKEAEDAKDAANQKMAEYKEKLALLDSKVKEIEAELKKEGEAEKAKIISDAKEMSEKIKLQAKITVEQEIAKAKTELKAVVAELSLETAEKLIKEGIKGDDQSRMAKESIDKINLN